jgi:glycosyltransferase involved in cell wall biosynthesis
MKKARRKVILVDVFFQHLAQTGIKTYTNNLLQQIEAYHGDNFTFIIYPPRRTISGSTFFRGKTARWKNWIFQMLYFSHKLFMLPLLSVWFRVDLVFSPDILSPLWSRGISVSVIHDAFFWESPEHYNPLWRKFYLFLLQKSLDRGTHVLTISHHAQSVISKYAKTKAPITVLPTGLDLKVKTKKEKENSPLPHPYFIHVGVLEKRKNIRTIIEAFSIFLKENKEPYYLVLVGQRGPREALDDYEGILELVQKHKLQDKVIFTGYLEAEKLEIYYQFAAAYVFPSRNEGFGLPVLEAFSYGLPVLIGPQEALKEIGGNAVLVSKSFTAQDFALAMQRISKDEVLRSELIESGIKRLSSFTGKKFFLSLQDYFNKLIDE